MNDRTVTGNREQILSSSRKLMPKSGLDFLSELMPLLSCSCWSFSSANYLPFGSGSFYSALHFHTRCIYNAIHLVYLLVYNSFAKSPRMSCRQVMRKLANFLWILACASQFPTQNNWREKKKTSLFLNLFLFPYFIYLLFILLDFLPSSNVKVQVLPVRSKSLKRFNWGCL
jgi:hypothetical protein